jgi:hypothetical protein
MVWLAVGGLGPSAWRWMYLIGVLPALVTLWIGKAIPSRLVGRQHAIDAARRMRCCAAAQIC